MAGLESPAFSIFCWKAWNASIAGDRLVRAGCDISPYEALELIQAITVLGGLRPRYQIAPTLTFGSSTTTGSALPEGACRAAGSSRQLPLVPTIFAPCENFTGFVSSSGAGHISFASCNPSLIQHMMMQAPDARYLAHTYARPQALHFCSREALTCASCNASLSLSYSSCSWSSSQGVLGS